MLGLPVVLIGGGPSAGQVQLERLRGRAFVVAINDCFRRLPWADMVFTADGRWLKARAAELKSFAGRVVAALPEGFDVPEMERLEVVRRIVGVGVSADRKQAYFADNSGFAALNWTVAALPAGSVALVGFDLTDEGWWHAGYEWDVRIGHERYPEWASAFDVVAPEIANRGVDVVNANPASAIKAFRFASFDAVVDWSAW